MKNIMEDVGWNFWVNGVFIVEIHDDVIYILPGWLASVNQSLENHYV